MGSRTHYRTAQQLNAHKHTKEHQEITQAMDGEQTKAVDDGPTLLLDNDSDNDSFEYGESFRDLPLIPVEEDDANLNFSNKASQRYFYQYHIGKGNNNNGISYLVKLAYYASEDSIEYHDPPLHHTDVHMDLALLCHKLTRNERDSLASLIQQVYRIGCEDGFTSAHRRLHSAFGDLQALALKNQTGLHSFLNEAFCDKYIAPAHGVKALPLPSHGVDINRMYLKEKYSIVRNLPMPQIFTTLNDAGGHAYIRASDAIRDMLGHGVDITPLDESALRVLSVEEEVCNHAKNGVFLLLGLVDWQDDFEPNTFSKTNRGSVWIKTLTVVSLGVKRGQTTAYTYPIAVGRKGTSHEEVEQEFTKELDRLCSGEMPPFYMGACKQYCDLRCYPLVSLMDQPERRGANYIGLGNAIWTARWGFSANHKELYANLKACADCLEHMASAYKYDDFASYIRECPNCMNWNIVKKECSLAFCKLPVSYPDDSPRVTRNLDDTFSLCPFEITYHGLTLAVETAHKRVVEGKWTPKAAEAYLKVEGLNDKAATAILTHANNVVSLNAAEAEPELLATELRILQQEKQQSPQLYKQWAIPSRWDRGVFLWQCIDPLMHLLFLGVVRSAGQKPKAFLTAFGKHPAFTRAYGNILEKVKSLQLDWLRVLKYGSGTFGGWVSENFLAYARIMSWFYQGLESVAEDANHEDDGRPPDALPQTKWLLKHNKWWLKRRGLDSKGLADALKARVRDYMEQPDGPPEPLPLYTTCTATDVTTMLHSLTEMLKCIMVSAVADEKNDFEM